MMPYALNGTRWYAAAGESQPVIRWSFATQALPLGEQYPGYPEFTLALNAGQQDVVRAALESWSAVAGVRFVEQADSAGVGLRIGAAGIDGAGQTLGQATYWSSNDALTRASIVFDTADLATATAGTLLGTSAHEIGHVLGLGHSDDPATLMYPTLGTLTAPASGDIAGVRALYGAATAGTAGLVDGVDAAFYLDVNADVRAAGLPAAVHYRQYGWHEGRDPNAWFDTDWYLAHNPDVAAAGIDPYQHYRQYGWHEGRDPSAGFDTTAYLAANPDVALAGVAPLDHWLQYGIGEDRHLA